MKVDPRIRDIVQGASLLKEQRGSPTARTVLPIKIFAERKFAVAPELYTWDLSVRYEGSQ